MRSKSMHNKCNKTNSLESLLVNWGEILTKRVSKFTQEVCFSNRAILPQGKKLGIQDKIRAKPRLLQK
jgi:hypothetical protein